MKWFRSLPHAWQRTTLFSLLSAVVFFSFGLVHLNQFITADEHYWIYERVPQYWKSIAHGEWIKTAINDKPGVTIALISSPSFLIERHPGTICITDSETEVERCDTQRASRVLVTFRLPLLIVNALLIVAITMLVALLYGHQTARWSSFFVATSPLLIGMSQIINPDALLWSLGTTTLLTFLALLKTEQRSFIWLTGIGLGLAILTKYTASILIPFFALLLIVHPFFDKQRTKASSVYRRQLIQLLKIFGIALTLIIFFLPAIWLKPKILLVLLFAGEASSAALAFLILSLLLGLLLWNPGHLKDHLWEWVARLKAIGHLERWLSITILALIAVLIIGRILYPDWVLFEKMPFDLKDLYSSDKSDANYFPNFFQQILLELNPLVFSTPPSILLFLAIMLFSCFSFKKQTISSGHFEDVSLTLFGTIFVLVLILSEVLATARYLILLYPIIAILSARGLVWLVTALPIRTHKLIPAAIITIILFTLGSTWFARPFYANYTNILLPKSEIIHHAWGYGGYEAAQYLNSLPNAQNLLIWSDYYGVCEFFVGRCVTMEYKAACSQPFDYAVLSYRGDRLYHSSSYLWRCPERSLNVSRIYKYDAPVWQFAIGNRPKNFIKIVPLPIPE